MNVFRLGAAAAIALGLFSGGLAVTTAQNPPAESLPARIVAGTCGTLDQAGEPAFQLADATYALPTAAGASGASTPTGVEHIGPATALPVATSVTTLDATVAGLVDQPHALVALGAGGTGNADAIACGDIGGTFNGQDLLFGLQEQRDSGYVGVGWVTTQGEGSVTVTAFLTSREAPARIMTSPVAGEAATTTTSTAQSASGTATAETPAATAAPETTAAPPAAGTAAAGLPTTVTIEAVDINFIPDAVTVPANTDVTIDLPNHGQILHNFSITDHKNPDVPNLGISVNIQPGETQDVTVNAPPGDYYYYCNIPGHEAAGMFGTIHVVAQ